MNLPLFLARHLYHADGGSRRASRPAVVIAQAGIALGLAVMMVSVCVIVGFKSQVRGLTVGFGGDMQVNNLQQMQPYEAVPMTVDDRLLATLSACPDVEHVQRYALRAGLLLTDSAFQGVVLKGLGGEYDTAFLRSHLVKGALPAFNDTAATNEVLLSQDVAQAMRLDVGSRVSLYFIDGEVRTRRPRVAGIYRTGFAEVDGMLLFTDMRTVNRLNGFAPDQAGGVEIRLKDGADLEQCTWQVGDALSRMRGSRGEQYAVRNVEQLNPALFSWLGILDVNIWVILALMAGVAAFTMTCGLLILILERTQTIGVLKSLGASDRLVRRSFLALGLMLIVRGMAFGNLIALGICVLQRLTGLVTLDSSTYYMDTVPVAFPLPALLLLNVCTFLLSVLILWLPTSLILRIRPADSMRYE